MRFPGLAAIRKSGLWLVLAILASTLLVWIPVGVIAVRNAIVNMRLSDICPDYFSSEYACVAGPDGRGLDSVAVTMRDNSDLNMIYRTFTDSAGRFELFNDFYSFTLHGAPTMFHVYVSAGGNTDTILYKFERYRTCHFRKTDGPDTIRFSGGTQVLRLTLENPERVAIAEVCEFAPWESIAMGPTVPAGVAHPLSGFAAVSYGTLPVHGRRMVVASAHNPTTTATEGSPRTDAFGKPLVSSASYYVLDRNFDRDLANDQLYPWNTRSGEATGECAVRRCTVSENLVVGGKSLALELAAQGVGKTSFTIQYRPTDAVRGQLTLGTTSYRAILWDRGLSGFSDLSQVTVALDRDFDGDIDCRDGSCELFADARMRMALDTVSFVVDTILASSYTLQCSDVRVDTAKCRGASVGALLPDLRGVSLAPFSLWKELGAHPFVALYFFEGNSTTHMEALDVAAMRAVIERMVGPVHMVGVNRRAIGPPYTGGVVVVENKGWDGPFVRMARNQRDREMICVDSLGEVVSRAAPGRQTIEALWEHLARKDLTEALGQYEAFLGGATLVGTTGHN